MEATEQAIEDSTKIVNLISMIGEKMKNTPNPSIGVITKYYEDFGYLVGVFDSLIKNKEMIASKFDRIKERYGV